MYTCVVKLACDVQTDASNKRFLPNLLRIHAIRTSIGIEFADGEEHVAVGSGGVVEAELAEMRLDDVLANSFGVVEARSRRDTATASIPCSR